MDSKLLLVTMTLLSVLLLSACGWGDSDNDEPTEAGADVTNNLNGTDKQVNEEETEPANEHAGHSEGVMPEGLKESENPKFPVGSRVVVNASHTDGMEGAMATVKGAYDTTVYSVSYTPTNGDPFEENHKWFVEGEISGVDDGEIGVGSDVIINIEHQDGMQGAEGSVDTVEDTTVYVVDYTNSLGETVTNHLWLKESELQTEEESNYDSDWDGDTGSDTQ
ncbi:YdhK family protein [Ureibacillus aquaedulcis]|uniref:DUF1541 domain-containing protein n=1 Tax=Ureibacillus aquaedulcis TaxID=3058421 RepID=A0ABT8GKS2_9BACL|nr:YdhK family protein [Ureibacillus sp. BA0131]MDN4492017.1 DUF1541 domain-containing protein [Ureibacillus sp. BA0131]